MVRGQLRIGSPGDLDPLGEALSALGIGMTLVDRELRVRWANALAASLAAELSCGGSHCFAGMITWGSLSG